MEPTFTAVYRKVPEGYVAFVEELPSANTQEATLEETQRTFARRSPSSSRPIGRWPRSRSPPDSASVRRRVAQAAQAGTAVRFNLW